MGDAELSQSFQRAGRDRTRIQRTGLKSARIGTPTEIRIRTGVKQKLGIAAAIIASGRKTQHRLTWHHSSLRVAQKSSKACVGCLATDPIVPSTPADSFRTMMA